MHNETGSAPQVHSVLNGETASRQQINGTDHRQPPAAPRSILHDCELITPQMLPLVRLDQHQIDGITQALPGGARNVQDIYPLSSAQEGMLFHRLSGRNDTYVLSTLFELESRSQVDALIRALNRVVERHEILRTSVHWERLPRPVQVVHRHVTLPVVDLALEPREDALNQLRERMKPGTLRLDIRKAPIALLQIASDPLETRWYAVFHVHHLLCDHQSLRLLVAEVIAYIKGYEHELPPAVPFRNYIAQSLANATSAEAEAFFRSRLKDVEEPTAPFELLELQGEVPDVEEASLRLDTTSATRIRNVARHNGVSTARLFHAVWALVVARTCGRDDVVFGTVVLTASQRSTNASRMLGPSINTLPLRLRLRGVTAIELVRQTDKELKEILKYEAAPLTLAQSCSGICGSAPLFTALLNYRRGSPGHDGAEGVRVLARGEAFTNYPITLTIDDLGDGFVLTNKTDRSIGAERILTYVVAGLESLTRALESAPSCLAAELDVLPAPERRQVLQQFNSTSAPLPEDKLIHELIEEQVARDPDAIAIAFGGQLLTYAELNYRANQLARYLLRRGVGPNRLVALCVERGPEVLIGLIGVLKAGAAYIPLDPGNPTERLDHILADAQPVALLTMVKLKGRLPPVGAEVVALDSDWPEIASEDGGNIDTQAMGGKPTDLAYVIYTSGSTGKPKGVMVEHRNIVNYATHVVRHFDVAKGDGSLICTSISFDLMLTGLYPALLCGRTVRFCEEEHGLSRLADELLRHRNLSPLKLTPSHLPLIEQPLRRGELTGRVRVLTLGGEPLPVSAVRLWQQHAPGTRVFNHYGPTETTVGCLIYDTGELGREATGWVPIGRPISNTRVYVLDDHRQPVPIGVAGEIYIAGAGVSRGYLNQMALTVERFVRDPFSTNADARMYRTGDIGRWRPDGTIEFLGRTDHQVKIRGYRVETGEIEAHLRTHEAVKSAVVLAERDAPDEQRLVAYIVPAESQSGSRPTPELLREHIKKTLPEYMIPGAFVMLQALPLTPNGKLDRQALPAPHSSDFTRREYVPPEGDIEKLIADAWSRLLRVDRVGRNDDFFELGGHSLLAVRLIAHVADALHVDLPVRAIFETPTIQGLSDRIMREIVAEVFMEEQ